MRIPPERPRRRELLLALRAAEWMLRRLGTDWRLLPAPLRLEVLRLANRIAALLAADPPPPGK